MARAIPRSRVDRGTLRRIELIPVEMDQGDGPPARRPSRVRDRPDPVLETRDHVERRGGVRDLFVRGTRHVAIDAAIVLAPSTSFGPRQSASLLGMTVQAPIPVVGGFLARVGELDGDRGTRCSPSCPSSRGSNGSGTSARPGRRIASCRDYRPSRIPIRPQTGGAPGGNR